MPLDQSDVRAKIKDFVSTNFLLGKAAPNLKDKDSFLESGIVDSTGVLEFVSFLQDNWSINVADEELLPENFDSIENLTAFILKKTA
jgi:acyl carrier protein